MPEFNSESNEIISQLQSKIKNLKNLIFRVCSTQDIYYGFPNTYPRITVFEKDKYESEFNLLLKNVDTIEEIISEISMPEKNILILRKKLEDQKDDYETEIRLKAVENNQISKELKESEEKNLQLTKEIQRLKVVAGEDEKSWKIERNWIERKDTVTGKIIGHKFPINFDYTEITDIEKYRKGEENNEIWVKFKHPDSTGKSVQFDMCDEAFSMLKNNFFKELETKREKTKKLRIDNKEEVLSLMKMHGYELNKFKYIEKFIDVVFFLKTRNSKFFTRSSFRDEVRELIKEEIGGHSTITNYLEILEKIGIILKLNNETYEFLII
jgi:hypothetical protein